MTIVDERPATALGHLIAPGLRQDLSALPFHDDGPLVRWLMAGGALHPEARTHVAVHHVDGARPERRDYCDVHEHSVAELNLVLPATALRFDIVLGDEHHEVGGPASVFIPPGVRHSANVIEGSGFFVAILLGVGDYADAFARDP
jgi:hypothetical protein